MTTETVQSGMVLWALPAGETDALHQQILLSNATAERVAEVKILAGAAGFHSFRVQILDGTVPDFAAAIHKGGRR